MAKSPANTDRFGDAFPAYDAYPVTATVGPRVLFEVTVRSVVGTVYETDSIDSVDPRIAAYQIIANADMTGTFEFPLEDGQIETVVVSRSVEPKTV